MMGEIGIDCQIDNLQFDDSCDSDDLNQNIEVGFIDAGLFDVELLCFQVIVS